MDNVFPRSSESAPITSIKTPTLRPAFSRYADNGLLLQAWAPDEQSFLALTERATLAATSEPTQAGGLTPLGYVAGMNARGEDPSVSGYISNYLTNFTDAGAEFMRFEKDSEFMKYGADKYVEYLYQNNPEAYDLYTPEMKKMISNSDSAEQVRFKLRYFGNQLEAEDAINYYDERAGTIAYATAKTASALTNYVAADLVGNVVSFGAAGLTLKGVRALGMTSKALNVGVNVLAGAAEGGAYGWAYENNRVKTQQVLGNEDAEFNNTMVGWGLGLGAIAGLAGGYLTRNINNDTITGALADELHGAPMSSRRAAGMGTIDDMDSAIVGEGPLIDRVRSINKSTGFSRQQTEWVFDLNKIKHASFKNPQEAIEWMETARPAADELARLDAFVAEQNVLASKGQATLSLKEIPKTRFQETGVAPPKAVASDSLEGIAAVGNSMSLATSVGILQNLPFGKKLGAFISGVGSWAVKGNDYRIASGAVGNLYQSITQTGMRNGDQTIARPATLSMDGAARQAERFIGHTMGVVRLLNDNKKLILKNQKDGKAIMSEIVEGGSGLEGAWGEKLANAFDKAFKKTGERAARAGLIDKADDYFPILFNKSKITSSPDGEFVEAFANYLFREFERTGDLSLITARQLGWVEGTGKKMRPTASGKAAGLDEDLKLTSLNPEAKTLYEKELPASLRLQAKRAKGSFHKMSFESLLTNPDALDDGVVVRSFFTNSKKRQTLNKNIYSDPDMKKFMNQDITQVYHHAVRKLGAETEFALGQIPVHGTAVTFDDLVGKTRKFIARDASLDDADKASFLELVDKAQEIADMSMGRISRKDSAFAGRVSSGIVQTAASAVRAGTSWLWGIPVATMELPSMLLNQGHVKGLQKNMSNFAKNTVSHKDRWDLMSAYGEGIEATTQMARGMLEFSGHEGQYIGMMPTERFASPWINVTRSLLDEQTDLLTRLIEVLPNVTTAFANNMTQIGMMPVFTAAGRITSGLYSEAKFLKAIRGNTGNSLRKIAEGIAKSGGEISPKEFKTLSRVSGLPDSNEAALYNRAGMLDSDVLDFIDKASEAGRLKGDRIDSRALYSWAEENGLTDSYFKFSGAMTELVSERMNYNFATPNAMSRIDVSDNNPLTEAQTLFYSFPAAFYQQRMQMVGQDDTFKGMSLFGAYLGLETLHRAVRTTADPYNEDFGDFGAYFEQWAENPGTMMAATLAGGTPLPGAYPLGNLFRTLGTGRDLNTNIVEGKIERILKGQIEVLPDSLFNGPQAVSELTDIFNTKEAMD